MKNKLVIHYIIAIFLVLSVGSCKLFKLPIKTENKTVPSSYATSQDSTNSAKVQWRKYFTDPNLIALIDTALKNNQELNITMQEIEIAKNEVKARKGEYLPFGGIKASGGPDKAGAYTWNGQSEEAQKASGGKNISGILP